MFSVVGDHTACKIHESALVACSARIRIERRSRRPPERRHGRACCPPRFLRFKSATTNALESSRKFSIEHAPRMGVPGFPGLFHMCSHRGKLGAICSALVEARARDICRLCLYSGHGLEYCVQWMTVVCRRDVETCTWETRTRCTLEL